MCVCVCVCVCDPMISLIINNKKKLIAVGRSIKMNKFHTHRDIETNQQQLHAAVVHAMLPCWRAK